LPPGLGNGKVGWESRPPKPSIRWPGCADFVEKVD